MSFEPLQTDEPIEGPVKKRSDFESQLMAGCGFVLTCSLVTYLLSIWPFFIFEEYTVLGMGRIATFVCVPTAVFGIVAIRKLGLPAASGYFGGAMAAGVFMYLRLKQTMLGFLDVDLPRPEFPQHWGWLVPVCWILWCGMIALIFMPRESVEA